MSLDKAIILARTGWISQAEMELWEELKNKIAERKLRIRQLKQQLEEQKGIRPKASYWAFPGITVL